MFMLGEVSLRQVIAQARLGSLCLFIKVGVPQNLFMAIQVPPFFFGHFGFRNLKKVEKHCLRERERVECAQTLQLNCIVSFGTSVGFTLVSDQRHPSLFLFYILCSFSIIFTFTFLAVLNKVLDILIFYYSLVSIELLGYQPLASCLDQSRTDAQITSILSRYITELQSLYRCTQGGGVRGEGRGLINVGLP